MKMKTLVTVFFMFLALGLYAQEEGFHYKALVTDGGKALENRDVQVRFSLLDGTTVVYEETVQTTTDGNGILTTVIGSGTPAIGTFGTIDWNRSYSLKVEIDAGSGFLDFGTNPFHYVPYAKLAEKAKRAYKADNVKFVEGKNKSDAVYTDGNVGIGTNQPEEKLQVGGGTTAVGVKLLAKSGNASTLKLFEEKDYGFELLYDGSKDNLTLWSRKFTGNEDIRMTWLKTGRTGIGTTAPVSRLHLIPFGNIGEGGKLDITRAGLFVGDNNIGIAIDDNEIESSNSNLYLNSASKKDVVIGQDLVVRDDIIVTDNIKLDGKIEGKGSGFYDMEAFAYGNVNAGGKIKMATENVSKVEWTGAHYVITIKNVKLDYANYVCVTTPMENLAYPVILDTYISTDGKLVVTQFQLSAVPAAGAFSFVIFKK